DLVCKYQQLTDITTVSDIIMDKNEEWNKAHLDYIESVYNIEIQTTSLFDEVSTSISKSFQNIVEVLKFFEPLIARPYIFEHIRPYINELMNEIRVLVIKQAENINFLSNTSNYLNRSEFISKSNISRKILIFKNVIIALLFKFLD
ncbi:MAG: hypothetical protein MHPSP_000060, partial [Paramarteilia canceri]